MQALVSELSRLLGPQGLLAGDAVGERHRGDRSLSGEILPHVVMRPASTAEVSQCLRLCHAAGQAVVPQGGLTGLAGGANALGAEFCLSLERMSAVEEVDAASATITVQAGTALEVAQNAAAAAGLELGLDLGARGSCQIGGNLSTNAGGYRVIRHGMARAHVLGLEAVLMDGTVLSDMRKMMKNNTGLDWKQLMIGTEGTLGIITRAVLKLVPAPLSRQTALCATDDYGKVLELLKAARAELSATTAFECLWKSFHEFAALHAGLDFFNREPPYILILEQSGADPEHDGERFEAFLGRALERGLISDAIIAQSEKETQSFWKLRESLVLDRLPHLVNFDVSLEIARLGEFADACMAAIEARFPGCHHSYFGHIGDGNLHVCVSAGPDMHAVDELVYAVVRQFGGSISAEHGIGTIKRPYLAFCRSPEELALMRAVKAALDPKGLLNPGKVL